MQKRLKILLGNFGRTMMLSCQLTAERAHMKKNRLVCKTFNTAGLLKAINRLLENVVL